MICKNCGKEIDNKAAVCVNCGAAVKQKKSIFKKWWFWLIVIIVIAIVGSASGDSETTGETTNSGDATSATQETITYEKFDLKTMFDDLKGNAMKAEEKYQNKYVEITGNITNFDSDGSYISIEPVNADEWNFDTAMCYIKTEEQKKILMEKSIGDQVTIKGKVKSIGEVLGYSFDIKEVE